MRKEDKKKPKYNRLLLCGILLHPVISQRMWKSSLNGKTRGPQFVTRWFPLGLQRTDLSFHSDLKFRTNISISFFGKIQFEAYSLISVVGMGRGKVTLFSGFDCLKSAFKWILPRWCRTAVFKLCSNQLFVPCIVVSQSFSFLGMICL